MLRRTEGIVLKTFPFGEADLIVTFLTGSYGIVKTFAKSPRKTRSRFGSSLEPLTHSKISFWGREDAALPRLTQADIIHPFDTIRSGLQCFLKASEVLELTLIFMPERDACAGVYGLLVSTLHAMEADCGAGLRVLHYKLKLLDSVGYLPRLKGCGRCGGDSESFHLSQGSVVCDACSKGSAVTFMLSPGVISLASNLLVWDTAKIQRIKPADGLVMELSRLLDEHVKYVTERELKTRAFRG